MSAVENAVGSSNAEDGRNGKKNDESRIPVPSSSHFRRTGSLKLRNEMRMPRKTDTSTTPTQPLRRHRSLQGLASPVPSRRNENSGEREEDLDSERSFGSSCNSLCGGHSPFAHNGTTYSARNMKYVFHCSPHTGSDEYLTPTQRANRTIKRLRRMLSDAQAELLEKDGEIGRLTKEIVELRLLKAASANTDESGSRDPSDDTDAVEPAVAFAKSGPRFMDVLLEERDPCNVTTAHESTGEAVSLEAFDSRGPSIFPRHIHHSPSLADSGNFEDINFAHSLEKEIERLRQNYDDMREKHNEKVEQLLNIIADSNDRYYDLKPKYDELLLRARQLEKEIETLKTTSCEREESQRNIYLQLYAQRLNPEKASIRSGVEDNLSTTSDEGPRHSSDVDDLLKNLSVTKRELENVKDVEFKNDALLSAREAISLWILGTRKVMYRALLDASKLKTGNDAEMTLRFLKTAIFYFLTDTTNSRDHLTAIESILGFSDDEKAKIEKVQGWKY